MLADAGALASLLEAESARVLPTLGVGSRRNALESALNGLTRALDGAGTRTEIERALAEFDAVSDSYRNAATSDADGAAELTVLSLAVDRVRTALAVPGF